MSDNTFPTIDQINQQFAEIQASPTIPLQNGTSQTPAPPISADSPSAIINLINPDGELVGVQNSDVNNALSTGFRVPSSEEIHLAQREKTYGTPGQQLITGLESAASAATFGLSKGVEKALGVSPEAMREREEENPLISGTGSVAGLVGSAFIPGVGAANLLTKAGAAAKTAVGLGTVAKGSFVKQMSADAVAAAFENTLFQGGNEIGKAFQEDPSQTAEGAIANMGLSAVLGGVFGGALGAGKAAVDKFKLSKAMEVENPGTFVTAADKAKLDQGDFKTIVEKSGLYKEPDKRSIIDNIAAKSKDAPELEAIGKRRNWPVYEGMTGSPLVKKVDNALQKSNYTFAGAKRAQMYDDAYAMADKAVQDTLGEATTLSKAQIGAKSSEGLIRNIEEKYAPIKQVYDLLETHGDIIPVHKEAANELAVALGDIRAARVSPNSAEGQMVKRALNDIKNAKSIADIDAIRNTFKVDKTASDNLKYLSGVIRSELDNIAEKAGDKFAASNSNPAFKDVSDALLQTRKDIKPLYAEFRNEINTLSEHLGKSKISGPREAVNFIKEGLDPEQIAQRLFSTKSSNFVKFLGEKYPNEFKLFQDYQKATLKDGAMREGQFSAKQFFNKVNDLEPEIKNAIFTKEQQAVIKDAEKYIRSFPKDYNPSGTAHTEALLDLFKEPYKAIPANIGAKGMEAFVKSAGIMNELTGATQLGNATVKGWNTIKSGATAVFETAKPLPKNVISMATYNAKLDKLVTQYVENPQRLADIGDNNPVPQYSQAFAATSARAVQYLASIKPQSGEKQNPLDMKTKPNALEQAAYDRQLAVAQNPLSIYSHMKAGTLIPQDIITLKTIYPNLYNTMATQLGQEMTNNLSKGKSISYPVRLAMSMFISSPLDSTMTPSSIMDAQINNKSDKQRQAESAAPARHSTAKLSKLPQQYQTSSQARESADVNNKH